MASTTTAKRSIADLSSAVGDFKGLLADARSAVGRELKALALVPEDETDALAGVALAVKNGVDVHVRSGNSFAANDMRDLLDAGVAVDLRHVNRIAARDGVLCVMAGATVGAVADALDQAGLFLPLPADGARSIYSAVRANARDTADGALFNSIVWLRRITPNGESNDGVEVQQLNVDANSRSRLRADLRSGDLGVVIEFGFATEPIGDRRVTAVLRRNSGGAAPSPAAHRRRLARACARRCISRTNDRPTRACEWCVGRKASQAARGRSD
jgi:FAD/FMN-containing dehydrogenase